jgi:DNA segregation ATPase FtsK/SpoIIIE, S-DNA-T family
MSRYQQEETPSSPDWLDFLTNLRDRAGRTLQDVGALVLIVFAVLLLLGITGLSRGALLTPIATFLQRLTGWGSYALVAGIFLWGALALRRTPEQRVRWGRIIALEFGFFFLLTALSIFGGNNLSRVDAGLDGGQLGWGLAFLLESQLGTFLRDLIVFGGLTLSLIAAFGLLPHIEQLLRGWSGETVTPPDDFKAIPTEASAVEKESAPEPEKKPRKPLIPLPPQFRKSFKVDDKPEEKPSDPVPRDEKLPPLNLLMDDQNNRPDERHINQTAGLIEKTLDEFGIPAKVVGFRIGPTVTQFAVQPGFIKKPGTNEDDPHLMKVRVAQIAALQKDLTLALAAERLRIETPVPGRSYVGIEVPNSRSSLVRMRPILESETFGKVGTPLALALGRDVSGSPLVVDLARMPHMLIAGATGSGKSVCITAIAACLAMNNTPETLRLVMIDAKMVELIRYNGLPHLYGKVETNLERILGVLRWVVVEMEHRYRLLEGARVRDIQSYNEKATRRKDGTATPLPRIVVMIDELADLMMSAPDQTEHNLVRLAQMARATGIHLVVATQRPSTDVVTGLIKANFPARLAFSVASGIDSRVILDTPGAENLLGRGDMLFLNPEVGNPVRAQGVLITDAEIERVIAYWNKMSPASGQEPPWESLLHEPEESGDDALVEQAVEIVRQSQRASASLLQRRLRIGYPRAARLLDQLEEMGIVGPSTGGGRDREVLVERDEDE